MILWRGPWRRLHGPLDQADRATYDDLLLDLPSRLLFSLGAFPAAKGSLVRVLLDLLLDGDVLLLDGDVLLASVRICLRGCSSVRRKISWKCPSGIRVH